MNRRQILKLSAMFGAGLVAPTWTGASRAQAEFKGPYWIFLTANGGWDPRFLFDPTMNPRQNTFYPEIGEVGNIRFGTWDIEPDALGFEGTDRPYLNPQRFAERFGNQMTVFNGVDTSTNNHDAGQRAVTCGSISTGTPALGALLAATHAADKPLPFVSFGGYDATFDIAPLSRIGGSTQLQRLASPNLLRPEQDDNESSYHTDETWKRIRRAQAQRLDSLLGGQQLPKLLDSQEALLSARATDSSLGALKLPEPIDLPGNLGGAENLVRSGQLALAGFQAGLGVAANLTIGGFDTHGNHDQSHSGSMMQLLTGLGALLDEIDRVGLKDKVYVLVGSDFGRTPYNEGNGKDHWPVTSYLAFGPNIPGNRTIGATDDDQLAKRIDPRTLEVSNSGISLTPAQIHFALRKRAELKQDLLVEYPILGDDLPLLG